MLDIDLFCFKTSFFTLLWTGNQLQVPNFLFDCADIHNGLTNILNITGAMYEFSQYSARFTRK